LDSWPLSNNKSAEELKVMTKAVKDDIDQMVFAEILLSKKIVEEVKR
jgi:hypothetical protein